MLDYTLCTYLCIVQMLKLLRLIFMVNIQGYYMQFDVAIDRDVAAYMHIYV